MPAARLRAALRARLAGDDGFTLMETVAALGVVLVTMLGLLGTGLYAARSTVVGRVNQQAADVLNTELEALRSLSYGAVTLVSSDAGLGTDPAVTTVSGVRHYDPDPGPALGPERLDERPVGAVAPHSRPVTTPNGTYTVRRYVTVPSGTPVDVTGTPAVRRVTVEVSWTSRGVTRTRRSSTLFTNTRRGLPLPFYTFQYNGPATMTGATPGWTVNPGSDVSFGFLVRNQGARDAFTLAASTSGWTFYRDTDGDGLWSGDPATEPALNPAVTDLIEPSAVPFRVVAHGLAPSTAGTTTTVFSATSVAQPSHPARTVTGVVTVVTGSVAPPAPPPATVPPSGQCTPGTATGVTDSGATSGATAPAQYTLTQLRLLNGPQLGDTTAYPGLPMGKDLSGVQAQPCNWSTDLHTTQAGRAVQASTSQATGTVPGGRVRWVFQPASAAERRWAGTARLVLHVQCAAASPLPTLRAQLGTVDGSTTTALADGTLAMTACSTDGFVRHDLALALATPASVGPSGAYYVDVTSSAPVRLLYGTTAAQSRLVVGMR